DDPAIVLSRLRLALDGPEPGEALRMLESIDWDDAPPRHSSERLLLAGILHRRLGNDGAAQDVFARAVRMLSDAGLASPYILVPRAELIAAGVELPRAVSALADPFHGLADRPRLTPREREVLGELVVTTGTDRIAQHFHVSQNTVKSQLKSL